MMLNENRELDLDHLNKETVDKVIERLWIASGSLRGLGSLFRQVSLNAIFESEELFGIGQILGSLSEELGVLEDILNCGYDSVSEGRMMLNKEECEIEGSNE